MKTQPPELVTSPFEIVAAEHDLSAKARNFLELRERKIEAGRKTFLEVGEALLGIRDYEGGILYKKRYGNFEGYLKERWEFGRSYASRIMDAAEVYRGMLPRGNKTDVILPTTEKQLRCLKKLSPRLRLKAWKAAVAFSGSRPVFARIVEKEVRQLMPGKGTETPPARSGNVENRSHRISDGDLGKINDLLKALRTASVGLDGADQVATLVDEIVALLPR